MTYNIHFDGLTQDEVKILHQVLRQGPMAVVEKFVNDLRAQVNAQEGNKETLHD